MKKNQLLALLLAAVMLLAVLTLCFGAAAMAESVPEADAAAEQAALTDLTAEGR